MAHLAPTRNLQRVLSDVPRSRPLRSLGLGAGCTALGDLSSYLFFAALLGCTFLV